MPDEPDKCQAKKLGMSNTSCPQYATETLGDAR